MSNPIYVGEIVHKGERNAGQHEAIIDRETWDAVHEQLVRNAVVRQRHSNAKAPSLLAGLIFDQAGDRMVPSHASKAGRRYRYYVSNPASQEGGKVVSAPDPPPRLLSVAAVAGRLQVSTKTVRRWVEAGKLRIHRLGRCVRISDADLQEFIDQHRQ